MDKPKEGSLRMEYHELPDMGAVLAGAPRPAEKEIRRKELAPCEL